MILIIISIILLLYLYQKWHYSYWTRRGVYQIEPEFFYGNLRNVFTGKVSLNYQYKLFYDHIKSKGVKYGGHYELIKPTFIPTDLDIVKAILQKDFSSFMNRGNYVNEENDPLSGHLVFLANEKWRKLRAKLTPTFTTGKMKMMFPTMVACTVELEEVLKKEANHNDGVDIKEIMSRFTTDIIGSAAFGIECNSLKNPQSEFRQFGINIFKNGSKHGKFRMLMRTTFPTWVLDLMKVKMLSEELDDFFMGVVKSTVDYREKNNVARRDFMHLLLQLKNKGKVTDDEDIQPQESKDPNGHYLSFNEVAAQCFVFFLAGFETSSTATTFSLLELAQDQEIQEKARTEILTVLKKHNNKITYEGIMEMTYLDQVVNESLRLHPPAANLTRICNADFKVPNTDLVIQKGVRVVMPTLAIHRDPDHYPNPDVFDPERFNEENKAKRHPMAHMPFGEGPRMCIGSRFGLMQTKVGLVAVLKDYKVTLNKKTILPITYAPKAIIISVEGGLWLNLESLK